MPRAGLLRHRVQIQRKSVVVSATGTETETWTTIDTVWASVSPVEGREVVQGIRLLADVTHLIELRYRAGLTPADRFVFGNRIFDVVQLLDTDERHIELKVQAKEVVA